jgi:predicted glycoside hydrolase/deacetylase ChbG (UPF0249 family)
MQEKRRFLIVNGDDFGRSPGINSGVIRAREHGIVTSASLMVRWPAARQAAAYGRENPAFDLGLHVDLGEWAFSQGKWIPVYEVVAFEDLQMVESELGRQLERFRELIGRDPTHLDSHQNVHVRDPFAAMFQQIARQLNVPLRDNTTRVRYCGSFYGQTETGVPIPGAISVGGLTRILRSLPAGVTELSCHPAERTDIDSVYGHEREMELEVLCDRRVRTAIEREEIVLCSFQDVSRGGR